MPRIMTIWLPRWPVQRRLVERPELRKVPVFVCRRERRGVMTVVSWAWAEPPRDGSRSRDRPGRASIPEGMSLAEAMAVLALTHGSRACHVAEIDHDDPAADAVALEQLARWCRRFSPTVGVESAAAAGGAVPECIHLDVTGTADFFGGETPLVRTAVWTLAARGLHARAAIADTPGASWAAARHTDLLASPAGMGRQGGGAAPAAGREQWPHAPRKRRWAVVPPGAQRLKDGPEAVLAGLAATALRLDATTIGLLREVGIDSIGGVLRLSAKNLSSRFPPLLAQRRAQFSGTLAEPLEAPRGAELPQASQTFDFPVTTTDVLVGTIDASPAGRSGGVLERLLTACVAPLATRGEGVLALQVRLEHAASAPLATAAPTVVDVGLFRPSASIRHLLELVRLRLDRIRLPGAIEGIAVEVVAVGAVACRQRSLFAVEGGAGGSVQAGQGRCDTEESAAAEVGMLLERLAGRLGRAAVFEPRPVADAQPEHAWIATAPGARATGGGPRASRSQRGRLADPPRDPIRRSGATGHGHAPAGRRPIWMPPRPVRLEPLRAGMVAVAPDGPPVRFRLGQQVHDVAKAHGPERIETAWWRGPTVRRDYYVVETESGARFWLFRRLKDGAWFLHGLFA